MVNMSLKFDKEICNGVDYRIHKVHARTDGTTEPQQRSHGQTEGTTEPQQRCAGIIKNWLLKSDEEAHNAGQISDPYVRGSVTIGQTDTRTHRQTPDKVIPMCRYASQATQ